MYDGMTFDELNALYDDENDPMSTDYDEYFDDMDLTDIQKEQRKDSAESLGEIFTWLLALVFTYIQEGVYDYTEAIVEAQRAYTDLVGNTDGLEVSDYFLNNHIPSTVMNTVGTMLNDPEKMFNFTVDRARLIAENEANSMWNDSEFEEALLAGKTHKTWHAIVDKRTRDDHRFINGKTIPITEPFEVGDSLMYFPRDESLGASAEQIVNCRCSVSYS